MGDVTVLWFSRNSNTRTIYFTYFTRIFFEVLANIVTQITYTIIKIIILNVLIEFDLSNMPSTIMVTAQTTIILLINNNSFLKWRNSVGGEGVKLWISSLAKDAIFKEVCIIFRCTEVISVQHLKVSHVYTLFKLELN